MRLTKTDPTGGYAYLADGVSPASDVLSDGRTTFTPGISETHGTGGGTYASVFYLADAQGNSRGLLDGGQGNPDGYNWDAFGNSVSRLGTNPTAFAWNEASGYQTDNDSGLKLLGHRYYDSRTGRFISQDPAGDGDNWYGYCDNDPMNGADPSGLVEVPPSDDPNTPGDFWNHPELYGGYNPGDTYLGWTWTGSAWTQGQWSGPVGTSGGGGGSHDEPGPSVWQDAGQGALVGIAAVASVGINYGLYDGGSFRHDPSFGVSRGLADSGVNIASFATGLGEAKAAASGADLLTDGCFTAGTPVQTDGGTKPIQDIRAGDLVSTRDPQTGKTESRKVLRAFVHTAHETVTAQFADAATGQVVATVTATPEHPFFVAGRGFAALGSLGVGTQIVTRAGPALVVASLVRHGDAGGVPVYNLEVEGDHTYFVGDANGGLWVHNLCNAADILGNAVVKGKVITFKQALDRIRGGLDVFAGKRSQAKALAKAASGTNKAIGPEIHGAPADGFVNHFHPDPRSGSHIFFP